MLVTYNGTEISCAIAYKGSNCVKLVDSLGITVASFDYVTDFSLFTISGGDWTELPGHSQCEIAVMRPDGAIIPGGLKCSELPVKNGYMAALPTDDFTTTKIGANTYHTCTIPLSDLDTTDWDWSGSSENRSLADLASTHNVYIVPVGSLANYDPADNNNNIANQIVFDSMKYITKHYLFCAIHKDKLNVTFYFDEAPPTDLLIPTITLTVLAFILS